ncbi:hypothetical protein VAPA_2c11980 [Variovorax paradoxus B4]|uniref:Uncharacterized protein n=1 Tax=Variovorax paradoxus B4 TaxID=1246301 RepID=T1XLJ7_VARPD|nr:hypothetical protein VAPA_2c11980 [Variovorax paradoxus B4]
MATGASGTQLKVHLARLAELEYLLVYLALRGQDYAYELLQYRAGQDGKNSGKGPHLTGLIDAQALQARSYDAQRSASAPARSAPHRSAVGGQSADECSRPERASPHDARLAAEMPARSARMRHPCDHRTRVVPGEPTSSLHRGPLPSIRTHSRSSTHVTSASQRTRRCWMPMKPRPLDPRRRVIGRGASSRPTTRAPPLERQLTQASRRAASEKSVQPRWSAANVSYGPEAVFRTAPKRPLICATSWIQHPRFRATT